MPPLSLFASLLGVPPIGPVPHDLGEAPELSALVPEGRHHAADPEACAVLSDVPAVVLAPARLDRLPPLSPGDVVSDVFLGEKDIRRPAQYLALRIAQQAFGTLAPGLDESLGIDDEDGVVHHVLGKEAEQLAIPRFPPSLLVLIHLAVVLLG